MIQINTKQKKSRGYTLLFAVLVSALVLGVGVSILNIARKELILTASARESQYAFYAADTGYECALYWDHAQNAFSSSTFPIVDDGHGNESISCGTLSGPIDPITTSSVVQSVISPGTAYSYVFYLPINGLSCSAVTVTKTYGVIPNITPPLVGMFTTVDSRGYNVGWNSASGVSGDCSKVNPAKVERALYATY